MTSGRTRNTASRAADKPLIEVGSSVDDPKKARHALGGGAAAAIEG